MPTKKASSRKASTKKASSKKASSKDISVKRIPTAIMSGDKLKLDMPLDATKAAAIRRCLAKGTLKITLSRVDLAAGRLGSSYIYD